MLFMRRRKNAPVPEVGTEAPEFNLPSAQGGQLRLSMRTVRGPVVVIFFRGVRSDEDVAYFTGLSEKEGEINHAGASIVGIGAVEADEARDFARSSGMKSYILYDYHRTASREWGLLEVDKEHGDYARPAVFVVGPDHQVVHAWVGERPSPDEILAKVTEMTGLPKPPEEAKEDKAERPRKVPGSSDASPGQAAPADDEPQKMSAEERQRIKAERRAAREAGKSVKSGGGETAPEAGDQPKKLTAEEREKIKAERRAAREAGQSLKKPATPDAGSEQTPEETSESPNKEGTEDRPREKAQEG